MNVIFGTSGAAKEIEWLISDCIRSGIHVPMPSNFVGIERIGEPLQGLEIIHEKTFLDQISTNPSDIVYLAFGESVLRKKVFQKLAAFPSIQFPSVVHPSVIKDERVGAVTWGQGSFLAAGNVFMTNIQMGQFAYINIGNTIGHDCRFGDFVTLSPGCRISGNVTIGNNCFIGTGAVIIDKISIADNTIIGAGCVVTKDITEPGTYVGVPARKVK